jgi:hypothetical protein
VGRQRQTGQGRRDDTSGARVWMVDGWGFSLGLGNRITRDYGGGETDQFQMLCCDWCECCPGCTAVCSSLL